MNIHGSTHEYEVWMRGCCAVVESDLRAKHRRMRQDLFAFMRGTYYRWVQLWPVECPDEQDAPRVLAVGDLHVDSFGTWRDAEGRLAWGVDDFDEAYPLPYTNDLVRLAASAKLMRDTGTCELKLRAACEAILDGYRHALRVGGDPIVLAEDERRLEKLGIDELKPPVAFWEKLRRLPVAQRVPRDALRALRAACPGPLKDGKIVHRAAGVGSLGQPRFVLLGEFDGGHIAREAKALVPAASEWQRGRPAAHGQRYYERAIRSAIRATDPYQQSAGAWLIRRLSPDANPIEIADIPRIRDEVALFRAMGSEAANVHLGTRRAARAILADLGRRGSDWLPRTAKRMAKVMRREWMEYAQTGRRSASRAA